MLSFEELWQNYNNTSFQKLKCNPVVAEEISEYYSDLMKLMKVPKKNKLQSGQMTRSAVLTKMSIILFTNFNLITLIYWMSCINEGC